MSSELISSTCLAVATIYGEASGEPYLGKLAVAEVILNRMRAKHQSDGTVAGTVLKPWQFSIWNTREPRRVKVCQLDYEDVVVRECAAAWLEARDKGSDVAQGALYYHSCDIRPPVWAKEMKLLAAVGRHLFYKPKPKAT